MSPSMSLRRYLASSGVARRRSGAGNGEVGEDFGDLGEGKRCGEFDFKCWICGEEVEGGGAEVAVAAVGGGERCVRGSGEGEDGFGKQRAAGVELARVGFRERSAGEVEGEEAGVVGVRRGSLDCGDGGGDGGALLQAAGGGGHLFGELGEFGEAGHSRDFLLQQRCAGDSRGLCWRGDGC
jgi:hypothetical protein